MKNLDKIDNFSLLLIEDKGQWRLRIRYEISLTQKIMHERYIMSHRNKIRNWKKLDNAIAFIQADKKLSTFTSLKIFFENGLSFITE